MNPLMGGPRLPWPFFFGCVLCSLCISKINLNAIQFGVWLRLFLFSVKLCTEHQHVLAAGWLILIPSVFLLNSLFSFLVQRHLE